MFDGVVDSREAMPLRGSLSFQSYASCLLDKLEVREDGKLA
jgi:hypothetical protein